MNHPKDFHYSFGPVPSRRLGKSLGINNIPSKVCSYSCVYCQVGRTRRLQMDRCLFFEPGEILRDVKIRLAQAREKSEQVDFLTFVSDGEPTLDRNLGEAIKLLKELGVPLAVITNASLLWRDDVREELACADWVSIKVDAVLQPLWQRTNRPRRDLALSRILDGMLQFAESFCGTLVTETMLINELNTEDHAVAALAEFLRQLQPKAAFITIPTRPPAEQWVHAPGEEVLIRVYQQLAERIKQVECLAEFEGDAFVSTNEIEKDILNITAVHPMREDAMSALLLRSGASWEVVDRLVQKRELLKVKYAGHYFLVRKFGK